MPAMACTSSVSSLSHVLSCTSIGSLISSAQPNYVESSSTDSLTSEADCSCSGEGEETFWGSDAEASASDDNNEALNCKLHYPDMVHRVSSPHVYDRFNTVQVLELNLSPSAAMISLMRLKMVVLLAKVPHQLLMKKWNLRLHSQLSVTFNHPLVLTFP